METVTSYLKLLPETKEQVNLAFNQVKHSFLSGNEDALKMWIQFKAFESLLKAISSDPEIKDTVLSEAMKYGANSFETGSAKVQIKEAGTKWEYNDTIISDFEAKISELTETKKKREKMLQSLIAPMWDEQTGAEVVPAIKTSSTIVQITLK